MIYPPPSPNFHAPVARRPRSYPASEESSEMSGAAPSLASQIPTSINPLIISQFKTRICARRGRAESVLDSDDDEIDQDAGNELASDDQSSSTSDLDSVFLPNGCSHYSTPNTAQSPEARTPSNGDVSPACESDGDAIALPCSSIGSWSGSAAEEVASAREYLAVPDLVPQGINGSFPPIPGSSGGRKNVGKHRARRTPSAPMPHSIEPALKDRSGHQLAAYDETFLREQGPGQLPLRAYQEEVEAGRSHAKEGSLLKDVRDTMRGRGFSSRGQGRTTRRGHHEALPSSQVVLESGSNSMSINSTTKQTSTRAVKDIKPADERRRRQQSRPPRGFGGGNFPSRGQFASVPISLPNSDPISKLRHSSSQIKEDAVQVRIPKRRRKGNGLVGRSPTSGNALATEQPVKGREEEVFTTITPLPITSGRQSSPPSHATPTSATSDQKIRQQLAQLSVDDTNFDHSSALMRGGALPRRFGSKNGLSAAVDAPLDLSPTALPSLSRRSRKFRPSKPSPTTILEVKCMARTRIPTLYGPAFLHLYHNNRDKKEHLAIVVDPAQLEPGTVSGPAIRSLSLDAVWNEDETDMDRIIRGAYSGKLSPASQTTPMSSSRQEGAILDSLPPPLVRIHSECYTGETVGSMRCDCGEQLDEAMRLMFQPVAIPSTSGSVPGRGAIIYLRQEGRGIGLLSKIRAYNLQDLGYDTVTANLMLGHEADEREYEIAGAILRDLGLGTGSEKGVQLLTNNPSKVLALEEQGLRVVRSVPMIPRSWQSRLAAHGPVGHARSTVERERRVVGGDDLDKYMRTKVLRMGHMLPLMET